MTPNNLAELFTQQAKKNGNSIALEYKMRKNEPPKTITWDRLSMMVREIAYGLIELGVKKNDKVAILSNTRYEWSVFDLAILSCGGVVIPIYPTLPEEVVKYILNDSECAIVVVEDKGQLQKIRSQWEDLPNIKYAIVIEDLGDIPRSESRILNFKDVKDRGKLNFSKDPFLLEKHLSAVGLHDIATIIYTSGTTGPPKGVVLTHKNILSVLSSIAEALPLRSSDRLLSFLPLSHVFERVGGFFYAIYLGATTVYCPSVDQIGPLLKGENITLMLVVPRILEKILEKIYKKFKTLPPLRKALLDWALLVGKEYIELKNNKFPCPVKGFFAVIKYKIANILVFSSLRKNMAPKLRCFISGGAPLSQDIAKFFCMIGIPVFEGYGLTETSAPVTVNTLKHSMIGSVGKPLPRVEIKTEKDGEILIKGDSIFSSYYKDEKRTQEVFSDDWFLTGDLGEITPEGFLKITGRKKDIIVSSAGKNIAPQNIEAAIVKSEYISNVIVIGDKKKYLSALITLDPLIIEFAQANDLDTDMNVLCKHKKVIELIDKEIKNNTSMFADYEQIRRFTILPNDFTVETGEITPTLKVKRKAVAEKYKSAIDSMYPGGN